MWRSSTERRKKNIISTWSIQKYNGIISHAQNVSVKKKKNIEGKAQASAASAQAAV